MKYAIAMVAALAATSAIAQDFSMPVSAYKQLSGIERMALMSDAATALKLRGDAVDVGSRLKACVDKIVVDSPASERLEGPVARCAAILRPTL